MEIIVDDRERAVVPYLQTYSIKTNIDYKIQRNEVGDYAITYKGYILMAIERKTWTDLSASFRDGRKDNIKKLIELRNRTGCQLAYLIEGPAAPPLSQLFGRIPVRALRAHLDHLAIRDGVHMIYSKDEEYTALRLFELASNYLSIKEIIKDIDNEVNGGEAQDNTDELQINMGVATSITEQVLQCLPSVGSLVSSVLAENNITFYGLYKNAYDIEHIARLKYPSGATIGLERAKKLLNTKKLIDSTSAASIKIHVRILSTVPLISKKTAEVILRNTTLALILNGEIDAELLANIEKSEKAKLGTKAAQNILDNLIGDQRNSLAEPTKEIIINKPILTNRSKKNIIE
jgi:ERCC4-type nuclease